MWASISNLLNHHAKNAELELGGPRGGPDKACAAWVADLGDGLGALPTR